MWDRSLVVPLLVLAGSLMSSISGQLTGCQRGEGNWALSPIMQRDRPAGALVVTSRCPRTTRKGSPVPKDFHLGLHHICSWATSPTQSPGRARFEGGETDFPSGEKESVAIFFNLHKLQNPE